MHRPIEKVECWVPHPCFMGSVKRPWHTPMIEIHLMGIHRGMFRNDLLSNRFNKAVGIEFMYRRMGLVVDFSLN